MKKKFIIITTSFLAISLLLTSVEASIINYWWDHIYFIQGNGIKYPHPDRNYYGLSPYVGYIAIGTMLYHIQIDHDTSQIAPDAVAVACVIAGAIIGTIIEPPHGTIIGAVVGGILGLIAEGAGVILQDEAGCIWFWVSISFVSWLINNAWWLGPFLQNPALYPIAIAAMQSAFLLYGYLRLGSGTIYDAVGAGNPAPPSGGGGGGGGGLPCPTLFVWNGTDYVEEGLLDIHAESDITVQHPIQNTLALETGVYKLQLRELDNYTSHIDQVKLYAVDYQGEWHTCPLTYAYHNELCNVKYTLLFDDDTRVDLEPTEIIDLKFAQSIPYSQTAYFIFEINGYNPKYIEY
mgnify:CR=1 FL=1